MTGEMTTSGNADAVRDTALTAGQVILPFYLLADVSSSMRGDVAELNSAVAELIRDIQKDPVVDDLVMLSIITFNHRAETAVPLGSPSDIVPPSFTAGGGTSYSAAFREYHRADQQNRAQLRQQGIRVYRSCVFFLTDGEPGDADYLQAFKELFGYDPAAAVGNKAYPYFVPYGFRAAPEDVIKSLAYPNFGTTKGRWFLSRSNNVGEILKAMATTLGQTVISSGMSASQGLPQIMPPTPPPGSDVQFGDAGGGFPDE
jgi:hypothetical protein